MHVNIYITPLLVYYELNGYIIVLKYRLSTRKIVRIETEYYKLH